MSGQFIQNYMAGIKQGLDKIPLEKIAKMAELIYGAYEKEKQIFIMGNGGSAACAAHFACDINKGVSFGLAKRFKIICLNDNIPTMLAYANDISYEDIFVEQLKNFFKSQDVVIGISASGNSLNVVKAICFANDNNGQTISWSGFDGGRLAKLAHFSLVVPLNDMQQVEDIHLILAHILMRGLDKKLKAGQ